MPNFANHGLVFQFFFEINEFSMQMQRLKYNATVKILCGAQESPRSMERGLTFRVLDHEELAHCADVDEAEKSCRLFLINEPRSLAGTGTNPNQASRVFFFLFAPMLPARFGKILNFVSDFNDLRQSSGISRNSYKNL